MNKGEDLMYQVINKKGLNEGFVESYKAMIYVKGYNDALRDVLRLVKEEQIVDEDLMSFKTFKLRPSIDHYTSDEREQ